MIEPSSTPNPRPCPICALPPITKIVDSLIAAGETDRGVYETVKALGVTRVASPVFQRHRTDCRAGSTAAAKYAAGAQRTGDFALMVKDKAVEMMREGILQVTTQHGLQAQQILDARESKREDRDLMLSIARMLTAGAVPPDLIVVGTQYKEIESGIDPDDLEMVEA